MSILWAELSHASRTTVLNVRARRSTNTFATRTELDIQSNQRAVVDALGRIIMQYDYDMLSTRLRQISVDAGTRWMLNDAVGKSLLAWDSRAHCFGTSMMLCIGPQPLRPYRRRVETLAERIVYGEGQPNDLGLNLRSDAVSLR